MIINVTIKSKPNCHYLHSSRTMTVGDTHQLQNKIKIINESVLFRLHIIMLLYFISFCQ